MAQEIIVTEEEEVREEEEKKIDFCCQCQTVVIKLVVDVFGARNESFC
jgi:hypothetical protein